MTPALSFNPRERGLEGHADREVGAPDPLEAVSLKTLLSRPAFWGGGWYNTRLHWKRRDSVALLLLCESRTSIEKAAEVLGRSPTSMAHRARDTGLHLPVEWRDLIIKRKPRDESSRDAMQYPYVKEVRGEHADLLLVNRMVPHGLPSHIRADVCQEIMLALWQREVSIEELRADRKLIGKFISGAKKANLEGGGYALSLDQPMRDGRSWYDVLEAPAEAALR